MDHHTEVVVGRVGLQVHVVPQSLDVLRVVSLNALKHGHDLGLHAFHFDDYVNFCYHISLMTYLHQS